MTIDDSHQSSSSSSSYHQQPVVYGDIDSITEEFDWVAGLEENERLYQDKTHGGAIAGKYGNPAKVSWVWAYGRKWVQAYNRNSNGDSTENACQRIQDISDEVLELLDQPFHSKFDFYNNYLNRLTKYNALYKKMVTCIEDEKGLHLLKGTIESCEVNATNRDSKSTSSKAKAVSETIKKVEAVSVALKEKIDEYLKIQQKSQLDGKEPKAHLEEVLEMILNPEVDFEMSATNINRCQALSAADVKVVLSEAFGEAVVNDMLTIYSLDKEAFLNYDDFYALTMGIVSNLTYQDVHDIVKNKQGKAYAKLNAVLGAKLPNLADDKDVIEEKTLFKILNVLRAVDVGPSISAGEKPYALQLRGDLSSIESCNIVSEYRSHKSAFKGTCTVQKLKETFGYIEHLARDHTYSRFDHAEYQFRDGVIFPQYDENGNKVCRQAHKLFNKDFIFALGVSPIKGISEEEHKVQVVFRGTADFGSVQRDIKVKSLYGGPGGDEFAKHEDGIIGNVEAFLGALELDDVTLEISGHSLGATDAMRMAKLWAEHAVKKNASSEAYSKVNAVNLVTFNGPGYDASYRDSFYDSVVALPGKQFNVTLLTTHLDKVHKYGTFYAGQIDEGNDKPDNLNRRWIQFDFDDKLTHGDSLADVYNNGSIAGVGTAGYRKYTAHSHSYFKEHKRGTDDQMAPVEVRYFCMDKDDDKELIHDENLDGEVPVDTINKVFATSFSYTQYLESLANDDD